DPRVAGDNVDLQYVAVDRRCGTYVLEVSPIGLVRVFQARPGTRSDIEIPIGQYHRAEIRCVEEGTGRSLHPSRILYSVVSAGDEWLSDPVDAQYDADRDAFIVRGVMEVIEVFPELSGYSVSKGSQVRLDGTSTPITISMQRLTRMNLILKDGTVT